MCLQLQQLHMENFVHAFWHCHKIFPIIILYAVMITVPSNLPMRSLLAPKTLKGGKRQGCTKSQWFSWNLSCQLTKPLLFINKLWQDRFQAGNSHWELMQEMAGFHGLAWCHHQVSHKLRHFLIRQELMSVCTLHSCKTLQCRHSPFQSSTHFSFTRKQAAPVRASLAELALGWLRLPIKYCKRH